LNGVFFPAGWHTVSQIALRTGVIYLVVLIGVRLSGKREVGQMTPFDHHLLNGHEFHANWLRLFEYFARWRESAGLCIDAEQNNII